MKAWMTVVGLMAAMVAGTLLMGGCARPAKNVTSLPASSSTYSRSVEAAPARALSDPAFNMAPRGLGAAMEEKNRVLPGTTVGEELWVIYRPEQGAARMENDEQYPRTGSLMTKVDEQEVALPLKHTAVRASVMGYIASVDVQQQFANPYDEKIEAVYVFPLPENGAVNEFVMTVGTRKIRGMVRERAEAEKIYREAKAQGYAASLLTQERPNIFTQSVANIEPGKQIDIEIRYYNTLSYGDGWYEFVFPMVVGPRFNPPGFKNGVGAAPKSGLARSGQKTDVHYLKPGERSGHDIALELTVTPGVTIEEYECRTHQIEVANGDGDGRLKVKLADTDSVPNKDFVFRYRVAGGKIKSSLITHQDERGGYFTMMLYPPASLETLQRGPVELVFVLDCSGSMSGKPLNQAKAAISWALKNLDRGDTFQLINFSNDAQALGARPLAATKDNIERGLRHLASLRSEGGTMMIEGIKAALDFPHDPKRLRFVCFMTDGYIGNESEILGAIQDRLGESRIFSFGVGSSVNRFLMESMAKQGFGAVAYLGLEDDGAKVMRTFLDRVAHPAMTDVKVDWGSFDVSEVYPKRLPDLFVGKPVVVTGRYKPSRGGGDTIQVSGKSGGARMEVPVAIYRDAKQDETGALPSIWARLKMADLLDRAAHEPSTLVERQVRETALEYQLLSPYTAFLALDASRQTAGESAVTVPVAVPVPEGVRYDTTVQR